MHNFKKRLVVECRMGKITEQCDVDAIVNPANPQLSPGWGISGSIHAAAGPDLYQECRAAGLVSPGKAFVTEGYRLPCRRVVHCVVPVNKHACTPGKLRECFRNVLQIAEELGLESLAIPALVPGNEVARLAKEVINELATELKFVRKIRFVLIRRETLDAYRETFGPAVERNRKIS
ncbi:MAG: RNase III inhibitor [Firmicutes bacterium]|nr:RNase III inhibitor [Bacillota bacterium]